MSLDRAALRPRRVSPDFAHKLGARDDSATMPDQRGEEIELLRSQRELRRAATHGARAEVDREVVDLYLETRRGGRRRGALEERLHAREDLEQPAWLHDV